MYKIQKPNYDKRRKVLKKFIFNEDINERSIRGKYTVTGYRKYFGGLEEVDIKFEGEIYCRFQYKTDWHSVKQVINSGASKIKVNRLVRKGIFSKLSTNLLYFSVTLTHYSNIKKLSIN